jgi:hypothetical protein
MFLQQEVYPTNDRSVPPQAGDLELLEGARLSKQIAARAQVSSWHISDVSFPAACPQLAKADMLSSEGTRLLRHRRELRTA